MGLIQNNIDLAAVTRAAGGEWHGSYGSMPCPVCQLDKRRGQRAVSMRVEGGRLLGHCHKSGCDFQSILTALGLRPGTFQIDKKAQAEAEAKRAEYTARNLKRARAVWDYGKPIQGTPPEAYLRGRGITCSLPDSLRYLADTYHTPSGQYVTAMVADVQPTGGVHRTYFTKQGIRLTKSERMMLGPVAGGAVRLSDGAGPLVVAEGIETALSLLSGLLSGPTTVWAALSTSGMKALHLPPEPAELIIATDSDDKEHVGRLAGKVLATRANTLGWKVSMMPAPAGQDWNDVLQSGMAE